MTSAADLAAAVALVERATGRTYRELTPAELHAWYRRNTEQSLWSWRPRAEDMERS